MKRFAKVVYKPEIFDYNSQKKKNRKKTDEVIR